MQLPQPPFPKPVATNEVVPAECNPTVTTHLSDNESPASTNMLVEVEDWPRRVSWYEAPETPVPPAVLEESATEIGTRIEGKRIATLERKRLLELTHEADDVENDTNLFNYEVNKKR